MSQTIAKPDIRQQRQPESSPSHPDACFKPVALPALAAAVRAGRKQPRQPEKKADPPAILRKDAMLD